MFFREADNLKRPASVPVSVQLINLLPYGFLGPRAFMPYIEQLLLSLEGMNAQGPRTVLR